MLAHLGEGGSAELIHDAWLCAIEDGVHTADGQARALCTDHWRCRFISDNDSFDNAGILQVLASLAEANIEFVKTENLYEFDGTPGYSMGQGQ